MTIALLPWRRWLLPQLFLGMLALATNLLGYTKAGTIYSADGSQSDVAAAIAASAPGNTVTIPAGTFTWGAKGTAIYVNKAIVLQGSGTG
jgi:hypothetical protein